jgi:hypothetical protein
MIGDLLESWVGLAALLWAAGSFLVLAVCGCMIVAALLRGKELP